MIATSTSRALIVFAFIKRAALLTVLWWVLSEGNLEAPLLAAAVVGAAAAASFAVSSPAPTRWRPSRVPRLAVYFLGQSLLGGWDVARRAIAPSLPIQPALLAFRMTLPRGFATVLFAWLVSLTPGTASVAIDGESLVVHALDKSLPIEAQLRELERHVAALYYVD